MKTTRLTLAILAVALLSSGCTRSREYRKDQGLAGRPQSEREREKVLGSVQKFAPLRKRAVVLPGLRFPRVGVDNVGVGKLAAEHFLERGLRHFAFVGHAASPLFGKPNGVSGRPFRSLSPRRIRLVPCSSIKARSAMLSGRTAPPCSLP